MFIVLRCPPVQNVSFAEPDTLATEVGTVVTFNCKKGYEFSKGKKKLSAVCLETRQWNQTLPDCEGTIRDSLYSMSKTVHQNGTIL